MLCGDVWGVWIGFGIVAAGTLLGELGNFLYVPQPLSRSCSFVPATANAVVDAT